MAGMSVRKYWKPRSLTFWAGFVPILAGAFVAFEPVHGLTNWAVSISALYGDAPPIVPINAGLALIGLRAAQPE